MKQLLNDNWHMKCEGGVSTATVSVPASAYSVLLQNKSIESPYAGERQYSAFSLSENDYIFSREFAANEVIMMCDVIILRFNCIDTLSEIRLNGTVIGKTDNMHRIWEFNIKQFIHPGRNILEVVLSSPTKYIRTMDSRRHLWGVDSTDDGYSYLRKAHYMFGWDWCPSLPDMGILRDVELLGYNKARFDGIYIRQKHENGRVHISAEIQTEVFSLCSQNVKIMLTDPDGETTLLEAKIFSDRTVIETDIDKPQLWNVRGYGAQPLYTLYAELYDGAELLDCRALTFGLRTVTVSRKRDEYGEEFAFVVNGTRIFSMGANYIPEDNIISLCSHERTRKLLEDCVKANYNTVRVWGGGYYPDDFFYDECDRLGLLVWQDFMFACAVYSLSRDMYKNIKAEITDNVKRLRSHPCIGLWCGNNEIESAWQGWGLPDDKELKEQYLVQFEILIPSVLKSFDPDRFYWPSSPSSGGGFNDCSNPDRGDAHYWDVWHGLKKFSDVKNKFFRFCSEFGFESIPCMKTVRNFAVNEKFNLCLPAVEAHQKCDCGNEKLLYYIAQNVHYPSDFEGIVYASQLMQAEAVRTVTEHLRSNRGRCMGAIYWQINDSNPVISWSGIDYYGRWKALHYAAKRFYAPTLITVDCSEIRKVVFTITNERTEAVSGQIRWRIKNNRNELVDQGIIEASAAALSAEKSKSLDLFKSLPHTDAMRSRYLEYAYVDKGVRISGGTTLFVRPKAFRFINPDIKASVSDIGSKFKITLSASAYAKGVCMDFTDGDCVFSDNWFDICGEEAFVTVDKASLREGISADEAAQMLTIRSYYDITT